MSDEGTALAETQAEEPPADPPPSDEPYHDEPYAALSVFDHPSIGRALRTTFADKRLGRAIFLNVLGLVVAFVAVQQLFSRGRLAYGSEDISFSKAAFLAFAVIETGLVSLFLPMSFFGTFFRERKEQCFDQVVVSGVSPVRLLAGRLLITLSYFAVVLLSALPFFVLAVIMKGATLGMVATYYGVMLFYMVALSSITLAACVAMDDTGIPVLYGLLAGFLSVAAAFAPRVTPAFAAGSPLRHVTVELSALMKALGLGIFREPALYGVETPCALLSILIYGAATIFALGYILCGPDLELTPGLNSFDTVAVGRKGEILRGRRLLTSTLLRTLQMRFLYENNAPLLQRWSPLIRVLGFFTLFCVGHAWFLGSVWPDQTPTGFGKAEKKFVYFYLTFTALSFFILAFVGAQSRSALRDRRPLLSLGGLTIRRGASQFGIFAFGLMFPIALVCLAGWLKDFPLAIFPPGQLERLLTLFALTAEYSVFVFALAFLCAMLTSNHYSASGRTLLVLVATNVLPFLWIIFFFFNASGQGASWVLDFSPFIAAFSLIKPDRTLPFNTSKDGKPFYYEHDPDILPFVTLHGILLVIFLVIAIVMARKLVRRWRAEDEESRAERQRILSGGGALLLGALLLIPGAARAQEAPPERPDYAVEAQVGFNGLVPGGGFVPFVLSVRPDEESVEGAVEGRLVLRKPSGESIARFEGVLQPGQASRFKTLVPAAALGSSKLQLVIEDAEGQVLALSDIDLPSPSLGVVVLVIDKRKSAPFDLTKLAPSETWAPLERLRKGRGGKTNKAALAYLDGREAPTSALGYSGVDAVILGDPGDALDPARAAALADWVARGGDLLVTIGDRAERLKKDPLAERLGEVFAAIADESPADSVDLAPLGRQYNEQFSLAAPSVARLRAARPGDAVALAGMDGAPLILCRAFGAGRVTLAAFDLWEAPLLHWPRGSDLIADLLSGQPMRVGRGEELIFPVLSDLQTTQAQITPAFTGLLLYAFIAGPLIYFALKAKNRGILAWVLVPATTLLFVLLTPAYLLVLNQSDSAYIGVSLHESLPGTSVSLKTSDMIIFSGGRERHSIQVQRPGAQAFTVVPKGRRLSAGAAGETPFTVLDDRGFLRIDPLKIAMWGTRYASIESAGEDPIKLQAELIAGDQEVELRIKNKGRYGLSKILILFPAIRPSVTNISYLQIDFLERGEEKTVRGPLFTSPLNVDKTELYDQMVTGLTKRRYAAMVRDQRSAWVFAKIDPTAAGEGILTDAQLRMNSWCSLAVASVAMRFTGRVPYGAARRRDRDRVLGVEQGPAGMIERHATSTTLQYNRAILPEPAAVTALELELPVGPDRDNPADYEIQIRSGNSEDWVTFKVNELERRGKERQDDKGQRLLRVLVPDAQRFFAGGQRELVIRTLSLRNRGDRARRFSCKASLILKGE